VMSGSPLVERLREDLVRHRWLPRRAPLVVGVSGGADSMALLLLLHELAAEFEWALTAAHVHHGLRGAEADADARFVEEWAGRLRVPFVLRRVEVVPGRGQSLEMAARDARRAALLALAEAPEARVVLAHQAEDQAETVMLRIIRGTGVSGLQAMRPVTGRIVRPLLGYRRAELEAYLHGRGVPWREDSSNRDPAILRNRLRHQLMPELRALNPRVEEALARLSRSAGELEEWAEQEARQWYGGHAYRDVSAGEVRLLGLRGLPRALAERVLRLAAREFGLTLTEDQVDRAMAGPTVWPKHHAVEWQDRDVVISAPFEVPAWPADPIPLASDGVSELPWGRLVTRPADLGEEGIRWTREGLYVRGWRPGDRILLGGVGQKKLQDVFVDRKVPRRLRRVWPVLVTDADTSEVVAVPGLVVDHRFRAGTGAGIHVAWERDIPPRQR
jgi:tRNA(Ile)-lysidine synthase